MTTMIRHAFRIGLFLAVLTALDGAAGARAASRTAAKAPARKKRPAPVKSAPAAEPVVEEKPFEAVDDKPTPPAAPIVDDAAEPAPAAAKPEPAPAPPAPETPPAETRPPIDVRRLRAQYDELRDAVFRSRARRETMEQALFSTKLAVTLHWEANRRYSLKRAELRLDGSRLWDSADKPLGDEALALGAKSMAPGAHVLVVRAEVRSRDNPKQGYVSEQSFTLNLPEGKETKVEVSIDEDGSLPGYNPDIEIEIDD